MLSPWKEIEKNCLMIPWGFIKGGMMDLDHMGWRLFPERTRCRQVPADWTEFLKPPLNP